MQQTQFDIGVIGGGLAGLSLAILAADAGYKIVLFEKETYPFHKVCGEYISLESYNFLMRLGLPLNDWKLPVIKKLQVSDVKGNAYTFPLDLGGFGISRYKIDNALYKLALAKGVSVFAGTKVNDVLFENNIHHILTNKTEVTTTTVAASFGKRSNIDIKWKRNFINEKTTKLNNYIGIKYHIRFNYPKDQIALHNFSNGYCGISAIEDDKYCLCYLTTANNLSQNKNSIAQMEELVLQQNPLLKNIFNNAEFLYDAPLTISQISFDKKTQSENHLLMIGDAAGMITPLCGNGMSMALRSSVLAFKQVDLFLKQKLSRDGMEKNYQQNWHKEFSLRLTTGRLVQRLMGGNFSTTIFLKLMHSVPAISKQIIQSTHGKPF